MGKYGLKWEQKAGLTNNERRDALWVRLAREGQETATVDAAWWAAAQGMASKAPLSQFEERAKAERVKLAREMTPGRGGNQGGEGPSRKPGTPGSPGVASGTQAERTPGPSGPGGKNVFSMAEEAMGTDGEGASTPINLAEVAEEWQTAGKGRRTSKKPKRVAIESPVVEKTPHHRQEPEERGAGGAGGTASEVGAAEGAC